MGRGFDATGSRTRRSVRDGRPDSPYTARNLSRDLPGGGVPPSWRTGTGEWRACPLRWRRRFAGTREQVREARRFVASLLAGTSGTTEAAGELGAGLVDDAVWVAGELAANAVAHSRSGRPGGTFFVQVMKSRHWIEISVTDEGGPGVPPPHRAAPYGEERSEPEPHDPCAVRESGHGLRGVDALAVQRGTYRTMDGGRVVWVLLSAIPHETS